MPARDPLAHAALVETVARLKHDLGKYVCFQARWLAPDASFDDVRAALEADLLATRRGPDGVVSAPDVWAGLRAPLVGAEPLPGGSVVDLSAHPELRRIDAAMVTVTEAVAALRADTLTPDLAAGALAAARDVADACQKLVRELRDASP